MAGWGQRIVNAYNGALDGWRSGPRTLAIDQLRTRYVESWGMYTGELFEMAVTPPLRNDPAVYTHTKFLWKHVEAVVDFYAGVVYQGALPTKGIVMPGGMVSAIPIEPQTTEGVQTDNLTAAIQELFGAWNWQQQMSLRPMYGAALGDCLTELVDDLERGFVYPQTVWPGYVTEIELDYVGNVRSYTLEYRVSEERNGQTESYTYRKEVDKEAFRYYRDDKPFDFGDGAIVPNPYGFVPAIWDRHRLGAPGEARGRSAIHGTRQALLQMNSVLSHAFDFQRKAFFAPIMVAGKPVSKKPEGTADVTSAPTMFDVVGMPPDARLLQAQFDIGRTRELLNDLRQGIVDENPEARFYQQMREMTQVSAPGAERLMGDVKNRVDLARSGYDSQTIKLLQMAISMCGMRANGDWRDGGLSRRQQVFSPFDLDSFDRGELSFTIQPRPIVYPSEQERIDLVVMKESLQTQWGMQQAGMDETTADEILAERQNRFLVPMGNRSFLSGE